MPLKSLKRHRLFSKNPLSFWRWASYFSDKRYELPYLNWDEGRKRRGYENPGGFGSGGEWVVHFKRFTLPYISQEKILENRKKEGLFSKF